MSATQLRDQAISLAKTSPRSALKIARDIESPWFRAQALAWVARSIESNPEAILAEAAKAASRCDDDYQRAAVRAWEIAAMAECRLLKAAKAALREATATACRATPVASRCEALWLLEQAAVLVDREDALRLGSLIKMACSESQHWRCKRTLKNSDRLLEGTKTPRQFFW